MDHKEVGMNITKIQQTAFSIKPNQTLFFFVLEFIRSDFDLALLLPADAYAAAAHESYQTAKVSLMHSGNAE